LIKAHTNVPVGVGFGLVMLHLQSDGQVADAVIVGSAFVKSFATLAATKLLNKR
jgi:tryptophan synthase alpha chain